MIKWEDRTIKNCLFPEVVPDAVKSCAAIVIFSFAVTVAKFQLYYNKINVFVQRLGLENNMRHIYYTETEILDTHVYIATLPIS